MRHTGLNLRNGRNGVWGNEGVSSFNYFRGRKLEPIKIKRIIWDGYKIVRVICDYKGES